MRVRVLPVVIAASLLPRTGSAQELKADLLAKVKAATVFVKARGGTGSGFLFRRVGSAAFLMTCQHVVGGAETADVVFGSGDKSEKSYGVRVIATDPDRDLACLLLRDARDLPPPLEIGPKTEVKETENVFVAGFPFGEMLSASSRNPEISLAKVTVSSIRKDDYNQVAAVQLSGDVNPGNSGGPVVDARGRVVGVAQSKIVLSQTAFAVPPESLHGFLKGRVKSVSFNPATTTAAVARIEVVMELVDPLGTLKSAGVSYIRKDQVKEEPQADKNGRWKRAHASMKDVPLRIDDATGTATGTFEVVRASGEPTALTLLLQSHYTQADGTTHWTQPGDHTVYFEESGAPSAAKPPSEKSPAKPVSPGKAVELSTSDTLAVSGRIPLHAAIVELYLARDGVTLYALDLSESKVYKIEAPALKITQEVEISENAVAMAIAPNESSLYVVGVGGPAPGAPQVPGAAKTNGFVQVVNARDLKVTSTFNMDIVPTDVEAGGGGTLYVINAQSGNVAFVDTSKRAATSELLMYGCSNLRLHPDQFRLYAGSYGTFRGVHLQKDPKSRGYPTSQAYVQGDSRYGGIFEVAPDGGFLVAAVGAVLKLSKTIADDLKPAGRIDPFVDVAMASGCATFYTSTVGGFIKEYSLANCELKKSIKVDRVCTRMALDAKRKMLYAVACPMPPGNDPSGAWYNAERLRAGDIVAYSLSER